MALLLVLVGWVFKLYSIAIIARALLPWFRVDYYHPLMRFLIRITEPPGPGVVFNPGPRTAGSAIRTFGFR